MGRNKINIGLKEEFVKGSTHKDGKVQPDYVRGAKKKNLWEKLEESSLFTEHKEQVLIKLTAKSFKVYHILEKMADQNGIIRPFTIRGLAREYKEITGTLNKNTATLVIKELEEAGLCKFDPERRELKFIEPKQKGVNPIAARKEQIKQELKEQFDDENALLQAVERTYKQEQITEKRKETIKIAQAHNPKHNPELLEMKKKVNGEEELAASQVRNENPEISKLFEGVDMSTQIMKAMGSSNADELDLLAKSEFKAVKIVVISNNNTSLAALAELAHHETDKEVKALAKKKYGERMLKITGLFD